MSVQRSNRAKKSLPVVRGVAFYDLDGTLTDLNLLHMTAFFASNLAQWGGRLKYVFGLLGRLPRIAKAEFRDRHLLNVTTFAANRLMFFRNLATGRLHEPVMAGQEKTTWCVDYATERGIDLRNCWGYADSHYDLPFLTALGHPVAVNPDRKLESSARSRQWPIVRFTRSSDPNHEDARS